MAERPASPRRTFGSQRAEILAAVANAVLLAVVMVSVIREAILRFGDPQPPASGPMFVLGALGLAGNIAGIWLLHGHAAGNLNLRGAYLEVAADLLASIGVLAAAALTRFAGWAQADAVLSLALAIFILPRIAMLLRDATDVLMETAPRGLDVAAVRGAICGVTGVAAVHDLHVWAITPTQVCLSAHVVGGHGTDRDALISLINRTLRDRFAIGHTTLQVEGATAAGADFADGCGSCDPPRPAAITSPSSSGRAETG
jgi:cobalt-zinc-cadmium efflux system protein